MATGSGLIATCCVLFSISAIVVGAAVAPRAVARGPVNTAVDLSVDGDLTRTVLECEASVPRPTSRISWAEYITNPNGAPISDSETVLPGHPNSARYTIDYDNNTVFNLAIFPTLLDDGGTYRCIDINDASVPFYAQLITIVQAPNCTTNIPDDGYVREDQYYTMECHVYYQGKVAPTMTWTGPTSAVFNWTSTTTASSVWAGFSVNMTRYMSGLTFDLLVNFTEPGFIQNNYASNVPDLKFTVSTPVLIVQWQPKSLYYVPVQSSYDIGQTIECHADANPAANFFWQNMATNERWDDYRLYVNDPLIGTQTVWCHAQNQIGHNVFSADLFFNLTVNPRTTTSIPTTTPTTTPAPAVSECDDVTGKWTAYSPHLIEMCLDVNNTNMGRIVGLMRNATDPYFIEIRGRTQPYKYSQFGLSGVWPVNIGAISFTVTCKKCYGNETMWISAVGRTVTDNSACGLFGNIWYSPLYRFYRTGPPCRGRDLL